MSVQVFRVDRGGAAGARSQENLTVVLGHNELHREPAGW